MASAFFVLFLTYIFQESFGTYFKKYQPFSWEAFWVLLSSIGVLCIPHIWCMMEVPHYLSCITAAPVPTLIMGALSGFFWRISSIWYSKAIDVIGVFLVTGVNPGLSSLLGSFVPTVILGTYPPARVLVVLLLGQLILLGDVIALSKADFMKNGSNEGIRTAKGKGTLSLFITGLIMALASDAGSAATGIGATAANCPVAPAVEKGVNPTSASLPSWVVVFVGGFLANFVYAIPELIRNKICTDYTKSSCAKTYFRVVLTSVVWFSVLTIYDKAAALLGTPGLVVDWVTFNGLALVIANAWGFLDEGWKGFEKAKRVAVYGNAVITAALVVVGISNGL